MMKNSKWGHSVVSVESVQDALQSMSSMQFDVFVVDLELPDSSGLNVIEKIPSLNYKPEKVVVCSATLDTSLKKELDAQGIKTLDKPFSLNQLRQLVHEDGVPIPLNGFDDNTRRAL
jgi:CheY-like chemotaxis protein